MNDLEFTHTYKLHVAFLRVQFDLIKVFRSLIECYVMTKGTFSDLQDESRCFKPRTLKGEIHVYLHYSRNTVRSNLERITEYQSV